MAPKGAPRAKASRGTGLVLEDQAGELTRDEMAFHMKTWDHFKGIPRTSLRLLVPGTCLTYEDARGFLSPDHYAFAWEPGAPEGRIEPGRRAALAGGGEATRGAGR